MTVDTAVEDTISIEQLQSLVRDEEAFTKFFKKQAFDQGVGKGEWRQDGKRGWRLVLLDGSYIRIKFFNTVKKIFNSKGIEIPGRESFLSYLDVAVMPAGMKGYGFVSDSAQHVLSKGRALATDAHNKSIAKLFAKADQLGIDLTQPEAWETYYAGK